MQLHIRATITSPWTSLIAICSVSKHLDAASQNVSCLPSIHAITCHANHGHLLSPALITCYPLIKVTTITSQAPSHVCDRQSTSSRNLVPASRSPVACFRSTPRFACADFTFGSRRIRPGRDLPVEIYPGYSLIAPSSADRRFQIGRAHV